MDGGIMRRLHIGLVFALILVTGCAGRQAFTTGARPGETVMLGAGWNQKLTRNNLTVTFTSASGEVVTYNPGDERMRNIFQLYPDPLSKLVVSDRAQISYPSAGYSPDGGLTFNQLPPNFGDYTRENTGQENDWSNTMVTVDLPVDLSPGTATIRLFSNGVRIVKPIFIDVLSTPELAERNIFQMSNVSDAPGLIRAVERAPHFVVRFSGPDGVIPHSMQVELDRTLAETGKPWVSHGRGDIQNIMWSDNATDTRIKVLIMPTNGVTVDRLSDFKFYVSGAVNSLAVFSVQAYDVSGNLLPDFSATTEFNSD